jgi:23S rRNA (adenine2503-C2)-methyltransferase
VSFAASGAVALQQVATLQLRLRALGAGPTHEAHLLRSWLQGRPVDRPGRKTEHFLPKPLCEAWPALSTGLEALATLRSSHLGADGSERLLVGLHDGQTVETVQLPEGGAHGAASGGKDGSVAAAADGEHGPPGVPGRLASQEVPARPNREPRSVLSGLCVSTQVGCAVGCTFCMTGQGGLLRQLGSAEIVAQVVLARQRRAVNKVVFMGMGEPAHNLEAVLEAIDALGTWGGIGHKNLVFSTVGDARAFERLPQGRVKPALALSLHTTRADLRAQLLPRAPRIDPAELLAAAEAYARATGYPLQVQWTLLAGVNDGDDEVQALIPLMRGRKAMLNLIPWNRVDGLPWRRPDPERAAEMARTLNRAGVLTRLRQSAGQDVEGGCGQLRARTLGVDGDDPLPTHAAGVTGSTSSVKHESARLTRRRVVTLHTAT